MHLMQCRRRQALSGMRLLALWELRQALHCLILSLVETGILTISQLIEKMSWNPAQILGSDRGTLQKGHPADIVIADIDHEYKIDKNEFASKGRNTPFDGWK